MSAPCFLAIALICGYLSQAMPNQRLIGSIARCNGFWQVMPSCGQQPANGIGAAKVMLNFLLITLATISRGPQRKGDWKLQTISSASPCRKCHLHRARVQLRRPAE